MATHPVEREAESRTAERELREGRERLAAVLDGTNDATWDWNLVDDVTHVNDRFSTMLGYAPHELEPGAWKRCIHPDDRGAAVAALTAHLRGDTPVYEAEYRLRTKDGGYRWVLDRGKVVERGPNGRALRVAGTHTDIQRRREAEQALRDALAENEKLVEELRAALQKVKTLSGLVPVCAWCHNIRTDEGYWQRLEAFLAEHTQARVSHGLCPSCLDKITPGDP
jgi:PAS domain S-box-containing protein